MTTFTEGPEESVKISVQRENARRKKSFAAYLALLLIPIAIGAYAIARAPSQTQAVANEVIPVVNANVQESIKPQVAEAVAVQAEPIIRERVDKHVDEAVDIRLKPVEARYAHLEQMMVRSGGDNGRVKELEARVATLEKQVAALARALQTRRPPQ
jgi:hypothetical protein